jgi:hypothetical protein
MKGCLTLCRVKHPFRVPDVSLYDPSVDAPASTLGYGESTRFGVHLDLRSMKTIGVSELSSGGPSALRLDFRTSGPHSHPMGLCGFKANIPRIQVPPGTHEEKTTHVHKETQP